jgi:deoxyadenosine/deoxycytidine kinase
MKRIIYIEGNISSGKSTVLRALQDKGYSVFEEPLEVWQNRYVELDGSNILGKFYGDMSRWSFQLEVAVMTTRIIKLVEALESPSDIVILERSPMVDRNVFAPNIYEIGKMTEMEWKIYLDWYNLARFFINIILEMHHVEMIFVNTTPEECYRRKCIRDRIEESTVQPDYFGQLHEKHVNWLIKGDRLEHKVHSIDGNETKEGVMLQIDQLIAKEHSFYEQSKAKKAPHDCTYTLQMTKRLKDFINESRKSAGLEVAN